MARRAQTATAAPFNTDNGTENVDSSQRYTDQHRCPICNGAHTDPPHEGRRCIGYLTSNGQAAFCSREEQRGSLSPHGTAVGTVYLHHLKGVCGCGATHEAATDAGLTLDQYAAAKRLDRGFLEKLGMYEVSSYGPNKNPAVGIPYHDIEGNTLCVQFRTAMSGPDRFKWKKGDKAVLYGQEYLPQAKEIGAVSMVEGASDVQTLRFHGFPAVGLPGADNFVDARDSKLFDGIPRIFVNIELRDGKPDSDNVEHLLAKLAKSSIHDRIYLIYLTPWEVKDPSALHLKDPERFKENWNAALASATSLVEWERQEREKKLAALRAQALPMLECEDPLEYVRQEFRRLGYGGDTRPAETIYLSVTSRVLSQQFGSMPAHTLLLGQSSAGKSWMVGTVRRLLPEGAVHTLDAGSPRVLIYDEGELRHRALFVGEADSLPSDPDNPASSAIRNLLQDNYLHYSVVEKGESGAHEVRHIVREGPTVLITTSTRRLDDQLDTRVFSLPVPDDPKQVRAILAARAKLDARPAPPIDPVVIAYQALLQISAPYDVVVPYADRLAFLIGQSMAMPRIVRDFERILSLIKAVTVLRHAKRQRRSDGRLVAEVADYAAVHELVGEMFESSVTGMTDKIRSIVSAVVQLEREPRRPITKTMVAKYLKIDKMSAGRHTEAAIKNGWLINAENRPNRQAALQLGESMPEYSGLPGAELLSQTRHPVTA